MAQQKRKTTQQSAQITLTWFVYSDGYINFNTFRSAKYMRFFAERTN